MKFVRWQLDSPGEAEKLRDLITSQWKWRSAYIDREGSVILTPLRIPRQVVGDLAAQSGLVCRELTTTGGE